MIHHHKKAVGTAFLYPVKNHDYVLSFEILYS